MPDRDGREPLPLLRRRLPAHLPDRERTAALRRRPRRPGEPQPALRQGAVRVRLRPSPATGCTTPLIRKPGVPKHADDEVDPANPWTHFRAATWDEGARRRGRGVRSRFATATAAARALAGFGSAKGSNEEAYLFQKLVRVGLRQQQRRSLHAALPRVVGRRPDGDDRVGSRHRVVRRSAATPT